MGTQGFRNVAGNPFVYQEDVRSASIGLDATDSKWKVAVLDTTGALPTSTAQITIDPSTNGNVTIDPNGTGNLVVSSGSVSITAGGLALPASTSSSAGTITWGGSKDMHTGETDGYFWGTGAGRYDTGTSRNIGIGTGACAYPYNNGEYNGADNICVGYQTLYNGGDTRYNENVYKNVALGNYALRNLNANCGNNVCVGYYAGNKIDASGNYNTLLGSYAGYQLYMQSGVHGVEHNTAIGYNAGSTWTLGESSNIAINSDGVAGDYNILRIGNATGTSERQLNKSYICGIYGRTPTGTLNIALIDSKNQLGSAATIAQSYLSNGMTWNNVTNTTQSAAVNNEYTANAATLLTITLPATAAINDRIRVVGAGAGGWKVAQNSGQTIHLGSSSTTTGTSGYIASATIYDCVELICVTTNTDWVAIAQGTLSVN